TAQQLDSDAVGCGSAVGYFSAGEIGIAVDDLEAAAVVALFYDEMGTCQVGAITDLDSAVGIAFGRKRRVLVDDDCLGGRRAGRRCQNHDERDGSRDQTPPASRRCTVRIWTR